MKEVRVAGLSTILDSLDETLTESSKVAAAINDDFLVRMLDMLIYHVRIKAVNLPDESDEANGSLKAGTDKR
jgi:hypothetical protein